MEELNFSNEEGYDEGFVGGGIRHLRKFVIGMKLVQSATRGLSVSYLPPKCASTCRRVPQPASPCLLLVECTLCPGLTDCVWSPQGRSQQDWGGGGGHKRHV